jgi:hypothetical protein
MDNKLLSASTQDGDTFLPGQTTEKHDGQFQLGLSEKSVPLASLKGQLEVEKASATAASPLESGEQEEGEIREEPSYYCKSCSSRSTMLNGDKRKPTARNEHKHQATRGRGELLASQVMSARVFEGLIERYGVNGYMQPGEKLDPIAIILRPGESISTYEKCFVKWLSFKRLTLETLRHYPEEERRYRQCYAYMRLNQEKKKAMLGFNVHAVQAQLFIKAVPFIPVIPRIAALRLQMTRMDLVQAAREFGSSWTSTREA